MKYKPRNDFVLFKITDKGVSQGGVALPQISGEGKIRTVVAIGPKVENLNVGDRVLVIGNIGQEEE